MDQMTALANQTNEKIRLLDNTNRRVARCTVQRLIRSTALFLNVSDDMFKSMRKSKQEMLKLMRRLSVAAKNESID
jgi:histone H3/H4